MNNHLSMISEQQSYKDILKINNQNDINFVSNTIKTLLEENDKLLPISSHPFAKLIDAGESSLNILIKAVKNDNNSNDKKITAIDAIAIIFTKGNVQKPIVEQIKLLLKKSKNPHLLAHLAKCLAIAQDKDFLQEQMKYLTDDDPAVVCSAATFLGIAKFKPAAAVLKSMLGANRFYESKEIIWALGKIGCPQALPSLHFRMINSFRVKECILAVANIGSLISIPYLLSFISRGIFDDLEILFKSLAMILHKNRSSTATLNTIKSDIVKIILPLFTKDTAKLSIATRFYMLLCLSRVDHFLDKQSIVRYLGVKIDSNDLDKMEKFFINKS